MYLEDQPTRGGYIIENMEELKAVVGYMLKFIGTYLLIFAFIIVNFLIPASIMALFIWLIT